ncbi:MAG: hypothetical protein KKI09_02525 [Spirochaetes bacterium]|nr:hypothetical protein [Spirochaetota bacterium]MBU0954280.1 hypothetical protein [Spirochaetota bacterium]
MLITVVFFIITLSILILIGVDRIKTFIIDYYNKEREIIDAKKMKIKNIAIMKNGIVWTSLALVFEVTNLVSNIKFKVGATLSGDVYDME